VTMPGKILGGSVSAEAPAQIAGNLSRREAYGLGSRPM
jgi:hypothetical protein